MKGDYRMINFFIHETQCYANGTAGALHFPFENRQEAELKYLDTRKAAVESSVLVHTVVWEDNRGNQIEKITYTHPAPEPEPEQPAE
jgi:hypothetical protein